MVSDTAVQDRHALLSCSARELQGASVMFYVFAHMFKVTQQCTCPCLRAARVALVRGESLPCVQDVDRGCLVCNSPGCVEDEQYYIFDCPAYDHFRVKYVNPLQYCCTVAEFLSLCEPNACGGFLADCFAYRKEILSV